MANPIEGKNNKRALEEMPSPNSFQSLLTQNDENNYSPLKFDFGVDCPNANHAMQLFNNDSISPLVTPKKIKLTARTEDVEMGDLEMGGEGDNWMNGSFV